MKLVWAGAVLALAMTAGAARPAAAQQQQGAPGRIGYVDTRLILRETPGYARAESTFTREIETYRAEVARLQASFDSAASQFEQQSVMLSPTQRQSRQQQLAAKRDSLETRVTELRQRADQRERELLDPIQQRVNGVIETVRAEGSFAMVFDVASPGSGIVAADTTLNLTARVIERLKAGS